MDESVYMLDQWDKLQPLSQQINQSISCDKFFKDQAPSTNCYNASNTDQLGFLQQGDNYWNSHNSNPITFEYNVDFQPNLNFNELIKERDVTFGYDKRHSQGGKKVNKGIHVASTNSQAQDHIVAERKRREKLNQRFVELSSIIPCLKKTDKASILIDAAKYVQELEHKVKILETQNSKSIDSAMLVKTSSKVDHGCSSYTEHLLRIDARFLENNMLISIHCKNSKGVLVKILSEIEELNFGVTHTNLMPFPDCTVFITITAEIEEGFSICVENVVQKLKSALNQFESRNQN